ncbi:MAG: L-seryl-tRNA(Sec) selenium transferase [Pyrinomonadaceae bacterium]
MEPAKTADPSTIFKMLPSVDEILRSPQARVISRRAGTDRLTQLARIVQSDLRSKLAGSSTFIGTEQSLITDAGNMIAELWEAESSDGLCRVINATGVIIHTNLGRAPLSAQARRAIVDEAAGYCSLEFDLSTGKRGRRGARAERLATQLTGAESAIIVNNCAAAAFLVLSVLAPDSEVIVSRGELVEIGGDFRIPDILERSGAKMVEVGTTNRTRLEDFENAITERTRMILRVHPSNYRIIGFTEKPTLADLAALALSTGIIMYEDAGSGVLNSDHYEDFADEPVISESIKAGADVVTFSGDKLLGGPQAGIVVGSKNIVEQMRRHPLYRALRADKLVIAALEATMESHARDTAVEDIPVLRMLAVKDAEIAQRTENFVGKLSDRLGRESPIKLELSLGNSVVGGGSAPDARPAAILISLSHKNLNDETLDGALRAAAPPVIARIGDGRVLIDLRTVDPNEEEDLIAAICDTAQVPTHDCG